MTVDELTGRLAAVYRAGKPYRFIRLAHTALAQVPHAPELAALTLRALTELSLGGPARELLSLRRDMCSDDAQFAALQQAVAKLPNGRVAWREQQQVFQRNVDMLERRFPHIADIAAETPELLRDAHLYRSTAGTYHRSRRAPGKLREWLPALSSEENDADVTLPPRGRVPVTTIIGLCPGKILSELTQRTESLLLNYSHPLYIIEPDAARFVAGLHVCDHTALLADERVHLFVGPDAVDDFARTLHDNAYLPAAQMFVDLAEAPQTLQAVQAATARVTAQRSEAHQATQEVLDQRYRDRDAMYWAERWALPGTVLAVTSRYTTVLQYATRDALAALRNLGYDTHLVIERADHEQMSPQIIADAVKRIDPDMILILDHLRYEYPQIPTNIPLLTWIQDPLPNLMSTPAGASVGPLDFVCGILKPRCVDEFGYPEERFCSVEMPVSLTMFHDAPIDDAQREPYDCDLCFVSNASSSVAALHEEALRQYPAALHPLLTLLHQQVTEMLARGEFPYDAAASMTREAAAECDVSLTDDQLRQLTSFHTYRMLDWGRRQESLVWAADWTKRTHRTFKLYGRGWENHPTLAPFAAGVLEHGEPLRRALRAAKLALQLIPSGIRHQRTYEILACGTLPLTRYAARDFARLSVAEYVRQRDAGASPDGENLFPGLERIAFETREQFESLAQRYLTDSAARTEVVHDLRQVVVKHCTFDAATRKVMTAFRKSINRTATVKQSRDRKGADERTSHCVVKL